MCGLSLLLVLSLLREVFFSGYSSFPNISKCQLKSVYYGHLDKVIYFVLFSRHLCEAYSTHPLPLLNLIQFLSFFLSLNVMQVCL